MSARPKLLTSNTIKNLKPEPQRYEVSVGGCNKGLRVVVSPSTEKSFVLRFRFGGFQHKVTLGPVLDEHDVTEPVATPQKHPTVTGGGPPTRGHDPARGRGRH
jgi:hypothetical protein